MSKIKFTLVDTGLLDSQFLENQAGINNYKENIQRGKDLFGSDFAMLGEGNLFGKNGDFKIVEGLLNLAQKLQHLLMTAVGTLPEDETYGIRWFDFIGKPYTNRQSLVLELSSEINKKLIQQQGVKSVDQITISFLSNTTLDIQISVTPITFQQQLKLQGLVQA